MNGLRARLFLLFAALFSISLTSAADIEIQYSEPLQNVEFRNATGGELAKVTTGATMRSLHFGAFSRSFEMRLQPNYALFSEAQRSKLDRSLEIYRGDIAGAAGSWVRLVVQNGMPRGMFWDGQELYAIEAAASGKPIIYRLADVYVAPGTMSCGHIGAVNNAGGLFEAVAGEMSAAAASGPGATQQLDMAVVADFEFTSDKGAGTSAAMVARINNVDGIFSSQVAMQLNVNQIDSFTDINDPFTDETDASLLIDEVSDFRFARPSQTANGLTHLFTGRDLAGTTVGIAFGGAICSSRFGAGLTQGTHSEAFDSLIAAHEIGHNFGAPHDGTAGSPCEAEPQTFLMAPQLNGSDQFSSCSLSEMQQVIATANCTSPLPSTDVAVVATGQPAAILRGTSETLTFSINSVGTNTADNVMFDVSIPALVTLDSITASSGNCTSGAGTASCTIGAISSGSGVNVDLDVTADSAGNASFDATVSATVDANANNNQSSIVLAINPSVDLSLTAAGTAQISLNASTTLNQTVDNLSDTVATNVALTITPDAGLRIDNAIWAEGSCSISAGVAQCQAGSLAAQSTSTVVLQVTGMSEGNLSYSMSIAADQGDSQSGNNNVAGQVTVGTPPPPPSPESGGGGSLSLLVLLLLASGRALLFVAAPGGVRSGRQSG